MGITNKRYKQCSGFTLVEILGFVIIAAMLILIAGPLTSLALQDSRVQRNRDNAAAARSAALSLALSEKVSVGYFQYDVNTGDMTRISSAPEDASFTTDVTDLSQWQKNSDHSITGLLSGNLGTTVYPIWVVYLENGEATRYYGLQEL